MPGGNVSDEKLKLISMMDQTLNGLDKRRREISANLDSADNEEVAAQLKKELVELDNQMSAVKGARSEFEKQYAKAKTEEERKQLEKIIKMAIMVGIVSESLRFNWERQKQLEEDKEKARIEMEKMKAERFERAIDKIFAENNFRFVTRDMIDEIMNNEKFKEMAENDPDRLNREEMGMQDEYNAMMARALYRKNIQMGSNFAENEEKLRNKLKEKNEFEEAVPLLKKFISGDLEKYGEDEDKIFFIELLAAIQEFGSITRRLDDEFVSGQSDFFKGNGYTREIIEKERSITKRIREYGEKHRVLSLELSEKGDEKAINHMNLYQGVLLADGKIKGRCDEDEAKFRHNEFRKETEMWKVYKQLPEENGSRIRSVSQYAINEMRAWSKISRMEEISRIEGTGSLLSCLCDWAKEGAQDIMETLKGKTKISAVNKQKIKEKVASLVIFQMVDNEQKQKSESKPFTGMVLKKFKKKNDLTEVAKQLAKVPEFESIYEEYMKGGDYKEKCIQFLAEDAERNLAQQIGENVAEVMKNPPQQEASSRLSRSKTLYKPKTKQNNVNRKSAVEGTLTPMTPNSTPGN